MVKQMFADLKQLSLEHLKQFKAAFSAGKQQAWVCYFPFLYFFSLRKSVDLYYLEEGGSICLFLLRRNRGDSLPDRMSLYVPPFPLNERALDISTELVNEYNKDWKAKIIWIDESTANQLSFTKGGSYALRYKEDEFLYDPKKYSDLSGREFRDLRNSVSRMKRRGDIEIRPYKTEYAESCMELLREWSERQDPKYSSIGDIVYTKKCLMLYDQFSSIDLNGRVVFVDGKIKCFSFVGQMHDDMGNAFIMKSDLGISGLNKYAFYQAMLQMHDYGLINGASDLGHAGLRFSKMALQPAGILPIYQGYYERSKKALAGNGK